MIIIYETVTQVIKSLHQNLHFVYEFTTASSWVLLLLSHHPRLRSA